MKYLYTLMIISLLLYGCSDDEGMVIVDPPSDGATIDVEVGGETQPNQVFVDLSSEETTTVSRDSWDLGFYSGDEFGVIVNVSTGALAYALDASDINQVTANDTTGLGSQLSLDAIFGALFAPVLPPWVPESVNWVDNPDGSIEDTAIDPVSATDNENTVYIINRGTAPDGSERGWMKVRIVRNGDGYSLSYAEINSQSAQTIEIAKDSEFNFVFFNFDNGVVQVEPRKAEWDIAFTTWTELTAFGPIEIPYLFNDFVIHNRGGVQVAEVIIDTGANLLEQYELFSMAEMTVLSFDDEINSIGDSWRTVANPNIPGSVTGVQEDRFYVIQDPSGNVYKLLFTRMLSLTGERGFPQIQYQIIDNDAM